MVATLCLVECSRFGLLETELLELLGVQPVLATQGQADYSGDKQRLSMAEVGYYGQGRAQGQSASHPYT